MSIATAVQPTVSVRPLHTLQAHEPAVPSAQGSPGTVTTPLAPNSVGTPQTTPTLPLRQLLADQNNLRDLAATLRNIATEVDGKPVTPDQVSAQLSTATLAPRPNSSYAPTRSTPQALATVITDLGFELPRTAAEVTALAHKLEHKAAVSPLGNMGGGLSWPIPMSLADQQGILEFLFKTPNALPGLPLPKYENGVLNYLLSGSSVTPADLQDPALALQKLLDSPKAQALGQALQAHLNGVSSSTSVYDYVLSALQLGLDRESAWFPQRDHIAGWPLNDPTHAKQSPSTVAKCLSVYLVETGRATAGTAKLATHLLLSRVAPQYLIKDIPKSVTIGSVAWVNLSIAAAAVEAERPGAVATMTFAEVMAHASTLEGRSQATEYAQITALVDWGVINGEIVKSPSDTYTPEQLDKVRTAFNEQLSERLTASKALDKEIPTREGVARGKIAEKGAIFGNFLEEKVLGTDQYRGTAEQLGLGGLHSLLDVAMMDLPNPRPFKSTDPSFPIEALNANPRFGVTEAFDQQFKSVMDEKKAAVNTTVRHMLSQLSPEDQQIFEYGKISVLQEGSYELTGVFHNTYDANKPWLLFSIELNGESHAYKMDINKETIEPMSPYSVEAKKTRAGKYVSTITPFKPSNAAELARERPVNDAPFNSFTSDRSRAIADAFVQHLDLDDPSIKEQARGQTTLDKLQGGPKPLSDFLLNLVPFRSAIVNFQKGNYGEAAFDLTLDIFGFLTAGAATAGKLIKIGSSALSSSAKALKAAKVIGAATIGALNPVSGLGDLATGGIRLLGSGGRFLLSKGTDAVNALKGLNASYDGLKAASKTHEVVAVGTFKVGEQTVQGSAVFHEGKWCGYDPIRQERFGAVGADFKPDVVAANGQINSNLLDWLGKYVAPSPKASADAFRDALDTAKKSNIVAYDRGVKFGNVEDIPGYHPTMKVSEIKNLAVTKVGNPEAVGTLAREIEKRMVMNSLESFKVFQAEVVAAGGKATPVPQNFYLSQADLASNGECAAMVNTMALAIQHSRRDEFISNFIKATSDADTPAIKAFRKELNSMHQVLRAQFHGIQQVSQVPYISIINRLETATNTTMIKISTQNHGLLAGVDLRKSPKEFFFFDPNFGFATFPDAASMRRGLEATLNSGRSAGTLDPMALTGGVPHYDISTFSDGDFIMTVPYNNPYALFNTTL